ncbi:MAG: hypothetical protein ACRDJW_22310 [Thermomicrobiales bacterium]
MPRTEIQKSFERLGLANDTDRAQFASEDHTAEPAQPSSDFVITRLSNSAYLS